MNSLKKHPDASVPYNFDYRDWTLLVAGGEEIVSAVVTGTPSGLTIGSATPNNDGDIVSVQISGGTAGTNYTLKCLATTTSGHILPGCGHLQVESC